MPPSPASSESASANQQYRWFAEEVHPCEPSLKAYIHASFPTVNDVDDVVQESFLRIWKARTSQRIASARAFLFTVARRLAVDRVRRIQSSPVDYVGHLADLSVVNDESDVAAMVSRREKVALLAEAVATLPARCREVFVLHKIKGHSRKEVAALLGLSEKTVATQTDRAMKRCIAYFNRRGGDERFEA